MILCFVKRLVKYIFFKIKYWHKLSFSFSNSIGIHSTFEGMNKLYSNSSFAGYMGVGTYIGENSHIVGRIGRFTSIAPFVRCNNGIHPYKYPFATTAPCFFSLKKQNGSTFAKRQEFGETIFFDQRKKYAIKIGNDCWVGEGSFIVGGVSIADGAVVLAHAVVTKNVPAYAIVGGVPAKIVGYRYDDDTIHFLQAIQWWNNDINWLKQNWELLCDIDKLKKHYKQ